MNFKLICIIWGIGLVIALMKIMDMTTGVFAGPSAPSKPMLGQEVSEQYRWHVLTDRDGISKCKSAVENAVQYDLRWTESSNSSRWNRWNKYARSDGYIQFNGDRAEAQNGFGNWVRITYWCLFDPDNRTVISASVERGKLPTQ